MIPRRVAISISIVAGLVGLGYLYWVCGGAAYLGNTPVFDEDIGGMDDNVHISVINVSGRPITVAVQIDGKLKMAATLPNNKWAWQDYRAAGGFPVETGQHGIDVRVAGAGLQPARTFALQGSTKDCFGF
jgi:hypothetical protein